MRRRKIWMFDEFVGTDDFWNFAPSVGANDWLIRWRRRCRR